MFCALMHIEGKPLQGKRLDCRDLVGRRETRAA
jgi:hypothetical protein